MSRVLFILKRREDFDAVTHSHIGLSTGLYNSAKFMDDMLTSNSITSNLEVAIDNNCIDRLVTKHKPTHVIIEALWVVPTKFSVLCKLHPDVTWIIRIIAKCRLWPAKVTLWTGLVITQDLKIL